MLLAMLAGLGYGHAYLKSGRIEAAILGHFTLNGIHFIALSYPSLYFGQRASGRVRLITDSSS